MSKILAIKGDEERGDEVIALLEMLGGKNKFEFKGIHNFQYFVDSDNNIWNTRSDNCSKYKIFTLDEFYAKYPYKIGDKVTLDNKLCTVIWMCWECNNIYYSVQGTDVMFTKKVAADELKPYKETNMNKKKKLTIKGHPTRGKEVIELLEMLGGQSMGALKGNTDWYTIDEDENNLIKIYGHNYIRSHEFVVLTLEEFWEKYPFKIGDKVIDEADGCPGVVCEMKWDEDVSDMKYCVAFGNGIDFGWFANDSIEFCKESENLGETPVRDREDVLFDSIIWHLRNSVNNGKQHLSGGDCEAYFRELVKKVKMYKPVYPKTYEECCERVNACPTVSISYDSNEDMLYNDDVDLTLLALRKLFICRNAYWKIAGEQMGLSGSWKPNWSDTKEEVYGIQLVTDDTNMIYHESASFTFPTEEFLNEFCKNFKYLIEQCKELL